MRIGDKFGRLKIIEQGKLVGRNRYWICICECGTKKEICYSALSNRKTKSCGCLNSELASLRKTTHGFSKTRIYFIWTSMKSRCMNKKNHAYENYGGRGITVCNSWLNSFENFLIDMGNPENHFEIERINNDLGYSKENCRWATSQEQSENRRSNCKYLDKGEYKTISQLSREYGIPYFTLRARLKILKWDFGRAITKRKQEKL